MRKILTLFVCCIFIVTILAVPCFAQTTVAVPILLYHNIADFIPGQPYYAALNTPIFTFERHMMAIRNAGYNPITYDMYYRYVTDGAELPPNPIMITFDDGYLSNYLYAYPILKRLNMKATIFVITDRRGKALSTNPHFSWNQAREMVDSGIIDIQSHTHSHQVSTTLSDEALVYELVTSKRLIELYTGKKCNVLAFPNGIADDREISAAEQAGYKIINLVGEYGSNRSGDSLSRMKRVTVFGTWTAQEVLEKIHIHSQL